MRGSSFPAELYKKRSTNDLILFSIYSINLKSGKCTFENLLSEYFTHFPKSIAFPHHSNWPDARKIDRPLRSLRRQGLIRKDSSGVINLSRAGKRAALEIAKELSQRRLGL